MQKNRKSNLKIIRLSAVGMFSVIAMFAVVTACSNQSAKAKPNFVFKDAPKAGVLAKIGGQEITEEDLIG